MYKYKKKRTEINVKNAQANKAEHSTIWEKNKKCSALCPLTRRAAYCTLWWLSNVKCVALRVPFSRDILNCVAVAGRIIASLPWWNLQETKNISHTRHGTCDAAFGFSDEKFREIFALLWVSCRVCVNAFLRYFFFFLLSCYNALLSQFYGIDSGVWGLFCCTCMYVFLKVIDSSMKLFAWFKLTTVVGCWKHRLEITKVLLFFR